jgi:GT2 family glycosyltransferase
MPAVGIVILNWNNHAASQRCLTSLRAMNYPNATVYLADNGSTDGSMGRLEQEFGGEARMIRNGKNLGFSAGCNRAIERALADGCRYVLLLNNDCILADPDFLEKGVATAESSPAVGIVGGKIMLWPDTRVIWSTGGFIHFWGGEKHIGTFEVDRGQHDRVARRTFISGALMLIKREVFDRIGLLPEAYFFGKEEWEFSTRASRTGFTLLYQPAFRMYHEMSNSHDWADPTYAYNSVLSRILYKRRNMSRLQFWIWRLTYATYLRVVFPLRPLVQPRVFLQTVPPDLLWRVVLQALRDSDRVDQITEELLQRFRESLPPARARPPAGRLRETPDR